MLTVACLTINIVTYIQQKHIDYTRKASESEADTPYYVPIPKSGGHVLSVSPGVAPLTIGGATGCVFLSFAWLQSCRDTMLLQLLLFRFHIDLVYMSSNVS